MCKHISVLVFCIFQLVRAQPGLNDLCPLKDNKTGVCLYIGQCEYANRKIYEDQNRKDVTICSWEGNTAIVCCPNEDVSYRFGPFSAHFDDCEANFITNKESICHYQGDVPMICCPKTPDYDPPAEPTDCAPLPPIKTPAFSNKLYEDAWKKCDDYRHYHQMCIENDNGDFKRTILFESRIATDDPKASEAQPGEFPHMAVLGMNDRKVVDSDKTVKDIVWVAGGSLISERYILTAAHVLSDATYRDLRYALLGALNKTDIKSGDLYFIIRRIPFKTYDSLSKHDDIALVELNRQVKFSSHVYPICLPVPGLEYDNTSRIITGWGRTGGNKDASTLLLKEFISTVPSTQCIEELPKGNQWVNATMTCARGDMTQLSTYPDTCEGDSGGPLMAKVSNKDFTSSYVVTGVVAWGPRNCGAGSPGVYTTVAPYVRWIVETVWPKKTVDIPEEME